MSGFNIGKENMLIETGSAIKIYWLKLLLKIFPKNMKIIKPSKKGKNQVY